MYKVVDGVVVDWVQDSQLAIMDRSALPDGWYQELWYNAGELDAERKYWALSSKLEEGSVSYLYDFGLAKVDGRLVYIVVGMIPATDKEVQDSLNKHALAGFTDLSWRVSTDLFLKYAYNNIFL